MQIKVMAVIYFMLNKSKWLKNMNVIFLIVNKIKYVILVKQQKKKTQNKCQTKNKLCRIFQYRIALTPISQWQYYILPPKLI